MVCWRASHASQKAPRGGKGEVAADICTQSSVVQRHDRFHSFIHSTDVINHLPVPGTAVDPEDAAVNKTDKKSLPLCCWHSCEVRQMITQVI